MISLFIPAIIPPRRHSFPPAWRYLPDGGRRSAASLVARVQEAVGDGLLQRLPGRGDDVVLDTDRAPLTLAVGGLDENAGPCAGAVRPLQDTDLVVDQLQPRELGVEASERDTERVVQGVDGAIALTRGDDPLALGVQFDGGLADHRAVWAAFHDGSPRLDLEVPLPDAGELLT